MWPNPQFPVNWTDAVKQSEPVYLNKPVRTHVTQIFIYKGVCYFLEPS